MYSGEHNVNKLSYVDELKSFYKNKKGKLMKKQ